MLPCPEEETKALVTSSGERESRTTSGSSGLNSCSHCTSWPSGSDLGELVSLGLL